MKKSVKKMCKDVGSIHVDGEKTLMKEMSSSCWEMGRHHRAELFGTPKHPSRSASKREWKREAKFWY